MKKNISLIIIAILSITLFVLIFFMVKNSFEKKHEEEILAANTGSKILKVTSEKNVTYIIEDYDKKMTYSWTFKNNENLQDSLKDGMDIDIDLKLDVLAGNENEIIDNKVSNEDKLIVSFNHHGKLPSTAKIRLQVKDKFKDGKKLYLYYYNPEKDRIEYMDKGLTVKDGYVEFSIDHCSDYLLTASVVQEAVNNPKNINLVIVGMVVVVIVLVGITLLQSRK